jgi:hypothetical protein
VRILRKLTRWTGHEGNELVKPRDGGLETVLRVMAARIGTTFAWHFPYFLVEHIRLDNATIKGCAGIWSRTIEFLLCGPHSGHSRRGCAVPPLAAGTVICPITIAPSGWSGALTLSGTNASSFALSGTNLVVGSTALGTGTYAVTITATP